MKDIKSSTTQNKRDISQISMTREFKTNFREYCMTNPWMNKREIRQNLHPTLDEEYLPSNDLYVSNLINLRQSQSKRTIKVRVPPRFYNRKREFDRMPQYNIEIPAIRISTPYEETRKSPRNWVGKDNFRSYIGKASLNKEHYIQNYVSQDPSEPPLLHKFRDKSKHMWLGEDIKF